MKKFFQILMMLSPLVLGLSSCDKEKELEPNPMASQVSGLWWTLIDTEGTLPENFSGQDYKGFAPFPAGFGHFYALLCALIHFLTMFPNKFY